AYITGQRKGDVMGIRYSDITDRGLFVQQKKTGNRVLIAMSPDLEAAVQRARDLHKSVKGLTLFHKPNGEPLSETTMYGHWVRACKAAGVEDANFHDIRAAAATDAKAKGMDSKTLLGHTTESSHNRYLRSKEIPIAQPVPARLKTTKK
ncbi:MAG: integrase, partial [Rhodocyclaceae bacterium]